MNGRNLVACLCFVAATYLIANGYDHGWGWLLFFGFVALDTGD